MKYFRRAACLLAFLFFVGRVAHAEWSLQSNEVHPGKGLSYLVKTIRDGAEVRQIYLLLLDPKLTTLRVVDNPRGAHTLGEAMAENGCLAGVNGSYFQPGFIPLGLEISKGRTIHPLERGKLISGVVVVNRGRVSVLRVPEFRQSSPAQEALQCGPFLVDHGAVVPGLNALKSAYRTVVISDGKGHCGLLMAESVTLAEMARILATPNLFPELKISRALNLDGGTSSALWVKEPPVYQHEFKRVRNFLGIVNRS